MPIIRPLFLLKIGDVSLEGIIQKRPSVAIKSPYVADIDINGGSSLAHTPSLGCCGLCEPKSKVIVVKLDSKKQKNKNNSAKPTCEYRVCLSIEGYTAICIYPKLAENIVEKALQKNYIGSLSNVKSYSRETSIELPNRPLCRFDFSGTDSNGIPFLLEVKAVPLANINHISYFPDGYRKKPTDPVSPRALKHIQELEYIKKERNNTIRCILCYVVQRSDTNGFMLGEKDPEYKKAVLEARETGVEILILQIHWTRDGRAYFVSDLLPFIE